MMSCSGGEAQGGDAALAVPVEKPVTLSALGHKVPAGLPEPQTVWLADDILTFDEYQASVFAFGECLEGLGLMVEYELVPPWGYDIGASAGPGAPFSVADNQRCLSQFHGEIEHAWSTVMGLSPQERPELWRERCAKDVIRTAGFAVGGGVEANVAQAQLIDRDRYERCVGHLDNEP